MNPLTLKMRAAGGQPDNGFEEIELRE